MQVFLTISAVVLSLFYLGRIYYIRFFGKQTKCDGCAMGKTSDNSSVQSTISVK